METGTPKRAEAVGGSVLDRQCLPARVMILHALVSKVSYVWGCATVVLVLSRAVWLRVNGLEYQDVISGTVFEK